MTEIPTTVKNKDLVERRRNQIVLAAIKLFSRNGFHKTTLKELAEEAGLSYGNIYDYVGNKEDIFFLIHDFLAGAANEILTRSIEEVKDPVEKLRRMVRGEFNLMDQWADALLLIYQESHILKGSFLKKLLEKERAHLEKFESALIEATKEGQLRSCNVRLVSNLIKSMIDSWTIKRWDLRGHASQLEAEQTILEIAFHGLLKDRGQSTDMKPSAPPLKGKTALVANAETQIGRGISAVLQKRGATVVVNGGDGTSRLMPGDNFAAGNAFQNDFLALDSVAARIDPQALEDRYGPIDIYVHDIGVGTTEAPSGSMRLRVAEQLRQNLVAAQDLSEYFVDRMKERRSGRIVYVAPWLWDRHANPINYESVKAGTAALCRTMAHEMAAASVNVNCLVPGYIRTDRPTKIEKDLKEDVISDIPAGRLGEIDDVAETVLFLVTDASKYLTGQLLHVTGGGD